MLLLIIIFVAVFENVFALVNFEVAFNPLESFEKQLLELNKRCVNISATRADEFHEQLKIRIKNELDDCRKTTLQLREEYESRLLQSEENYELFVRQAKRIETLEKQAENQHCEDEYAVLQQQFTEKEAEVCSLTTQIDALNSEVLRLSTKNKRLEEDLMTHQNTFEESEVQKQVLKTKTQSLEKELQEVVSQILSQIDWQARENKTMEIALREIYKMISNLQREFKSNLENVTGEINSTVVIQLTKIKQQYKVLFKKWKTKIATENKGKIAEYFEKTEEEIEILENEVQKLKQSKREMEKQLQIVEQKAIQCESSTYEEIAFEETRDVTINITLRVEGEWSTSGLERQISIYGSCLDSLQLSNFLETGVNATALAGMVTQIKQWDPQYGLSLTPVDVPTSEPDESSTYYNEQSEKTRIGANDNLLDVF